MGCSVTLKKLKVMRLLDLGERVLPGGFPLKVTLHACHCFGTSVGLEDYNSWDPSYPRGYQESGEPHEPLVSRRLEGFPFAVCQLVQQID